MANKRSAIDALMPGVGKSSFGNSSGINTDLLPNNSVVNTDSDDKAGRRRKKSPIEKAVKKTFSYNPKTLMGLQKYVSENGTNCSQVINLALRQLIPRSYFEDD